MSTAVSRNLAIATRERERRIAGLLDDPYDTTAVGAISDYPGNAFFGALREQGEAANAAGMNYRVDLSSMGRPGYDLGAFGQQGGGMQYPSDAGAARANAALGAMADENGLRQLAHRAAVDVQQQGAIDDMKHSYDEQVNAGLNAPAIDQPNISLSNRPDGQAPVITMRAASIDPRKQLLDRLSPAARLQAEAQIAAVDEKRAATTATKEKSDLERDKFKATYGTGVDENGQPMASPLAKQMAEYRMPPLSPTRMQTVEGQALMAQVQRLNPDYDGTKFPARNKMRAAFSSGPQSQTLNSLNTAIEHLDQFKQAADALHNGDFKPGNSLYNWVKEQSGGSAPTNFDGIKTIMAGELAAAFKKSGATDQEIAQVKSSLDRANSADQLGDYVSHIAIPALASKAGTFEAQWKQTMGDKDPFDVYTPGARAVIQKYQPAPAPGPVGAGAARTGIAVVDPSGGKHYFTDQAKADAFKKAAGIQ